MKVIDGHAIRVLKTKDYEEVKNYLKANPDYELLDTETWGDNPFNHDNWYYLVQQNVYKNGYVTIDLTRQAVVIFDPDYAKVRVRLADENPKPYLDWAIQCCSLFYDEQVQAIHLPKVSGNIEVSYPYWNQEREETIKILRKLCTEFGDNEWADDLHLRDVIEKHLAKYLWKKG